MDDFSNNFVNDDNEERLVSEPDRLVIDEEEMEEGDNDELQENNDGSQQSDNESNASSDSDVIFVEREEEVIDISDDEAHSKRILQNVDIPPHLLNNLQQASKRIHDEVAYNIRNNIEFREVITEVSNQVWSLPWEVVSEIFKNPNALNQKSPPKKSVKKKIVKTKAVKNNKIVSQKTPKEVKVKEEKMETTADERNLSVIHFDLNKPPAFCEVSRSGRLIKKPSRLNSITYSSRRNVNRRRNNTNNESRVLSDCDSNYDHEESQNQIDVEYANPNQIPSTSDSNVGISKKKSVETLNISPDVSQNSIINEQNVLCLNDSLSDSEESVSYISDMSEIYVSPSSKFANKKCSQNMDTKMMSHIQNERIRRQHMRNSFDQLIRSIHEVRKDLCATNYSKIKALEEGRATIQLLETEIKNKTLEIGLLKKHQKLLYDKLNNTDV